MSYLASVHIPKGSLNPGAPTGNSARTRWRTLPPFISFFLDSQRVRERRRGTMNAHTPEIASTLVPARVLHRLQRSTTIFIGYTLTSVPEPLEGRVLLPPSPPPDPPLSPVNARTEIINLFADSRTSIYGKVNTIFEQKVRIWTTLLRMGCHPSCRRIEHEFLIESRFRIWVID